ncbi:MAG: MoxR family ATPase [Nitrospinaceae bacterium]|jgi:MoxR-like ATPase|nr:MoxR family ATPase [Nitrospinaceae bacterium]MBT4430668.1 MoxR family ATPase [Nitrospinaceae bacterium]MBT5368340.1 MoxR family ATPase [Nitrospinaceae bacterium]MBT6395454.1 MoxR family ATPase [Nitrospinaceae bacterium]
MSEIQDEGNEVESGLAQIDVEVAREIGKKREAILHEVRKVIVGQSNVFELVLISLLAKGHCLLVGVPGLAKTLLVRTLAEVLQLDFNRIQFTPDLMPSDITGTDILDETSSGGREFRFIKGPVFSQILLADEVNRTPPKTQAALLQAMQEDRVTAGGTTHELEPPFFVLATQNPIEHEGTYPLPEAQLDRFMFEIGVDYPSFDEESDIVSQTTSDYSPQLEKVLDGQQILAYQALVRRVPAAPYVVDYAVSLARASRPTDESAPDFIREFVEWGAGPRASQYLILGARARALLHGRYAASIADVRELAEPVLRHRLLVNFRGQAEGYDSLALVKQLLEAVQPPAEAMEAAGART